MAKKKSKARSKAPRSETTKSIAIPKPDDLNIPPSDFGLYTTLLMGTKGSGKSTASSGWPGNLNYMWEPRRKNLKIRMIGAEHGLVFRTAEQIMNGEEDPWPIFINSCADAVADPTVKTITWDSVDIAYQACFESVCARLRVTHPKQIKDDYGNSWNIIKNQFGALIDTIRASEECGLLFISHVTEREQEFAEGIEKHEIIGPSCAPACLKILKAACDFWLYLGWDEGKRTVWCRDPDRFLDVACGTGFIGPDGIPLTKFPIPEDLKNPGETFYRSVNAAFRGTSEGTKKKVAKKKARRR